MVFEQLQTVRSKLAQSRRELDEIQSMQKFLLVLPEKVEQVYDDQHDWSGAKVTCNDEPLFDGDLFAEIKLWLDEQPSEPQETHVSVSDISKSNFVFAT